MYADKQSNHGGYSSANAMTANSSEPAARQRELPDQLEQMAKAQEHLDHSINELESRLGPVLRCPSPPQQTGEGKLAAAPPSTNYGADLYERVQRMHQMANRLQDFMRRLEV